MTTTEEHNDEEHESEAHESPAGAAPTPAAEAPTALQQAATGVTEAQAWKGQQIAKGWRKLVMALRRPEKGGA
jgi:hypothetical protein